MNAARAVFVGRERETEELLAGLADAVGGNGKLFIVEGEPGIGKTRLAERLASRASESGVRVVWSRGWGAGGAPSYWLWIQAIREFLKAHGARALASMPAGSEADLAQIVPEILSELPPARRRVAHAPADTEQARFRLFEAVAAFFRSASDEAPLLIALDDLATADRPSLLILHYLARELSTARIMVVATCRDAEVRALPALGEIMTELVRESRFVRLEGLSESETAELLRARTGHEPDARALQSVYRATAGNPFFIEAVATVIPREAFAGMDGRTHERLRLPGGLAAAVRGHLAAVREPVIHVLRIAALIGLEFDVGVLAQAAGFKDSNALDALGEAQRAGLVHESPEVPGRFQFRHALIRETLYHDIPAARRISLHARVGEVLENVYRGNPGTHLSEIAYHFYEGARAGGADRAFSYAEMAAEAAESVSAFEEAARCHQMALSAAKLHARLGDADRCRLMLKLGNALNRSGDYAGAADTFREAARLAEQLGDANLLVRAALGYPGLWTGMARVNQDAIELLELALRALGQNDSSDRAIAMARLAAELYHRPAAQARRLSLAANAIDIARRLGDKPALLSVLGFHDWMLSGPDQIDRRIHNADELSEVAEELGSYQGMYLGFLSRLICFRQRGDVQRAEAEAEAMALVARMAHLPVCDWAVTAYEAARQLLVGAFAEGEQTARRCVAFAERMQGCEAWDLFWPAMIVPFAEQDRLDEIAPMAEAAVAADPSIAAHRALLAWIHVLRGAKGAAESELMRLAGMELFRLPHDSRFLATLAALAQASAALGDARRAAEIYELLQPYAHLNVLFGPLAQFGSAARYLGVLAATCGRIAEAREWFERAITFNRKIEARPALAWTETEYAAMLSRTGASADLRKALGHLESAREIALELGMRRLEETIVRIRDQAHPGPAMIENPAQEQGHEIGYNGASPALEAAFAVSGSFGADSGAEAAAADGADVPAHQAIFRNDGDYWTIIYRGSVVRLRHGKGLTCLAYLLSHPEAEIHAASLAAAMADKAARLDAARAGERAAAQDLGDAGPMLDAQAKAEYRRRLQELRDGAEDARERGDSALASRLEEEMDFIAAELGRAVGIGGRDRRAASAAERARLNVTKAIKSVITKIAEHNRLLGQHLSATVKTGTFCSYTPDPASRISWKI